MQKHLVNAKEVQNNQIRNQTLRNIIKDTGIETKWTEKAEGEKTEKNRNGGKAVSIFKNDKCQEKERGTTRAQHDPIYILSLGFTLKAKDMGKKKQARYISIPGKKQVVLQGLDRVLEQ